MRLQLLPVAALAALCVPPMPAQQSVCDLFKDLKSHDGEHIVVRGELFLDGEQAAIGAVSCETRYISEHRLWPTAIELSPSSLAPPSQLAELRKQAIRMQKLDLNGQTIAAYGTFTGRLTLQSDSGVPARLIFDDARAITVEALPEASKLSVIPICDLFRDLPKYKDQRIAVRADFVATDEGAWLSGRCKGDFVTDGYRWPVSLWYGQPDYFGAQPFSLFRIDLSKTVPSSPAAPDLQGRQNVTTTATFVGRLHMRDKYVVRCTPEGRYVGYGFGHLSGAAVELIVESVFDSAVVPRLSLVDENEPDPTCEPPDHARMCAAVATLRDAAAQNCLDKLNELLKTNGIESIANDASAALAAAIRTSHDSIALALIAAGVPVNLAGDYQPLFEAARWHRYDLMEALIKAGADPNRKDSRGASWLATLGYFDATATKILLKAGADPSARDRYGATALMHASEAGYEEEVKLLLDHNADPNLRDNQGRTALMYAAQGKYVDSIPLLLDHGADPNSRDGEGHTAIDIAKTAGNTTAVKLIGKATGVSK